jgi:hypothetical protein
MTNLIPPMKAALNRENQFLADQLLLESALRAKHSMLDTKETNSSLHSIFRLPQMKPNDVFANSLTVTFKRLLLTIA